MQFPFHLLAIIFLAQHHELLANFNCPTDEHAVALGCSNAQQCTRYTTDPVNCIENACCIKSNSSDQISHPVPLICSNDGTALVIGCMKSQQCLPFTKEAIVACLQGICCTVPQKSSK
ncbi:hypothetical protein ACH3XW_0905 [Acanthocheilonema viteae]|uniref:Uncharacterized protein n=1 Tax=Acanthocheilonema viteae TaxID=6277 RepID=A0A498SU80_ACAVI|nr:unnamed protein product [Acanthocheilonema viteae]